jgi:hypothetical protein
MSRSGLYHYLPHHPFLVMCLGGDRSKVVGTADGPAAAYGTVVRLRQDRPGTVFTWMLRPDWSGAVKAMVRWRRHALRNGRRIGERERVVHVFVLVPGQAVGETLSATCGQSLPLDGIEWLTAYAGMPCEVCVVRTVPNTVLPSQARRHRGVTDA